MVKYKDDFELVSLRLAKDDVSCWSQWIKARGFTPEDIFELGLVKAGFRKKLKKSLTMKLQIDLVEEAGKL
jgi:hypothetical protein